MTDTDLRQRLTEAVDGLDAPADLLYRARQGGSRKLRRRRLASLATAALTVVAIGTVAVSAPNVFDQPSQEPSVAAVSDPRDPYGFLMTQPTRGDLAENQAYLDEVVATWDKSHATSQYKDRGVFDDLRGAAKVAWAGKTPGGRAAIVVQQAYLRKGVSSQLTEEGIYTLIGYIGDGVDGKPALVADGTPVHYKWGGFMAGTGAQKAVVVLDLGHAMGWSTTLEYREDGSSGRSFSPLTFKDGVSVVGVPEGVDPRAVRISLLPATREAKRGIAGQGSGLPSGTAVQPGAKPTSDSRLWSGPGYYAWPMTADAESLRETADDTFALSMAKVEDPFMDIEHGSMWVGYGKTTDGSKVIIGEIALDTDPTRVYAVLTSKAGKTTVVPGGIPDRNAALPVNIKLPNAQGWAVAAKDAQLSYRLPNGTWSPPRTSALLVPDSPTAEVKVSRGTTAKAVPLT